MHDDAGLIVKRQAREQEQEAILKLLALAPWTANLIRNVDQVAPLVSGWFLVWHISTSGAVVRAER
jgi:hypothetical protein